MRRRRIDDGQVRRAIEQPDSVTPAHQGRLRAETKTEQGNVVVVIYEEQLTDDGSICTVVTVWRES